MKTMVFALILILNLPLWAVDSTDSQIILRTFLDQNEVPLNKEVVYHVELSWQGDLQRYQIVRISEPVLSNLKLRGSGSSNRVYNDDNGNPHSQKRITYYFTPLNLGMGYIDGVSVQYEDKVLQQTETLSAQRLGTKILQPVHEPGDSVDLGLLLLIVLSVIFAALVLYFTMKYFKIRKQERETGDEEITIEEKYLQDLSGLLKGSNADTKSDFSALIYLFKAYLNEKFDISSSASFKEVQKNLSDQNINSDLLKKLDQFYQQSELSSFAGESISESDFHLFADTVEMILTELNNFSEILATE